MNYKETTEYMFTRIPMFQVVGRSAYKEGLEGIETLLQHIGNPEKGLKTIHVAGTNGKGSVSHTIASVLQSAGYKTGLFTSPHLRDFRERIRINGEMISEQKVIDFVEREKEYFDNSYPSFFEVCTALAFEYFKEEKVDIAVIEVGLGGRLDCTNVIRPEVSVITNISWDHTQILGDTLEKIAKEKAGIMKKDIPVVVGEAEGTIKDVFIESSIEYGAPLTFAEDTYEIAEIREETIDGNLFQSFNIIPKNTKENNGITVSTPLLGVCQKHNMLTAVTVLRLMQKLGIEISDSHIKDGISKTVEQTHLLGRWQILDKNPLTICDTGHNVAGITQVVEGLKRLKYKTLRIVYGMVSDKDISHCLELLPKDAQYYFTKASIPRAMNEKILAEKASVYGLKGETYETIAEALESAKNDADSDDVIFVGGSSYVVAEVV